MIRIGNKEWGLLLTFTAAVGCTDRGGDGGGEGGETTNLERLDLFAEASCECWNLMGLGDVYFRDQAHCLETMGATALGFALYETECTLGEIEKIPAAAGDLECHLDAIDSSIACFQAIDSCGYESYDAWTECFFTAAAWDSCEALPREELYYSLYPACFPGY